VLCERILPCGGIFFAPKKWAICTKSEEAQRKRESATKDNPTYKKSPNNHLSGLFNNFSTAI
jgi:hypothetical protein